jgi:hypothetical protein
MALACKPGWGCILSMRSQMVPEQAQSVVFERLFHARSRDLGKPETVKMPASESFASPNAAGD